MTARDKTAQDGQDARPATTRWAELTGSSTGADCARRFEQLAADGRDMHGEAGFCATLIGPPARVLDAGCGTGRVTIRLAELGYRCVGVDLDRSMLDEAHRLRPDLSWHEADLASLDAATLGAPFDLVVAAGNVIPLLAPGTLAATMSALAAALAPGGTVVTGFGLDAAHLPHGCPVTSTREYDAACATAGLWLAQRHSDWAGSPFTGLGNGYAVSVHRL
ncbi:class I SAM-dependent methyltransferase [Jatrophihabitans lederbergiae]|uniref:Class I SAM-dependent methyltransferase n=1 Tax=Jatrophihabitans lederbergiae TaxID=3075547 RepID=A0ABU2JC88_9ACTN|nr:class I SAM-dependent methyltransferase [Jatrophihabitans sp. DSM 44399]MDT0262608.1 class I SAM-dependent methyltransferase [Jatrophihabitans sp. DSM 44399]